MVRYRPCMESWRILISHSRWRIKSHGCAWCDKIRLQSNQACGSNIKSPAHRAIEALHRHVRGRQQAGVGPGIAGMELVNLAKPGTFD